MSWAVTGWIAFFVILMLSVLLHEAGHFLTARAFGMKVTEFFVGFGPRLWSFRRGETEYGIKAVPAGGYVRIVGMTDLEEVAPGDEERAFYRQPAPQRAIVLAAGSIVHFIIALVLFAAIPVAFGEARESLRIGAVADCVPATETATCTATSPPSPAKQVGLREGDKLVSVDGRKLADWQAFTDAIRQAGPGPVTLVVERDGRTLTLRPTLVAVQRPTEDDPARTETVAKVGVNAGTEMVRSGPVAAITGAGRDFGTSVVLTFKGLGAVPAGIPKLFQQTFGDEHRDADGLVGPVGIGRASGEVLDSQGPLAARIGWFLTIMATLNVFVGIFNLLPLLPVDGGHLAVLAYEKARQRLYRLFGRPDPGRVDLAKLLPAAYVFLVVIVGVSVLLLAADIVNPVSLNG